MGIAVLDAAGNLKAYAHEDGASMFRFDIARAKAWGAAGRGVSSRILAERAKDNPNFFVSLSATASGKFLPQTGAVVIKSADGTVIDDMRDDRYANLPLVVGEDANVHLQEYLGLIDAAGPLGERVKAGSYVSGRRWTLKLDGVDIRLPETGANEAPARLVDLERKNRLLEKDIIAVDLRMDDRVGVRLTEAAAAARPEARKKTKTGAAP